MVYQRAGGLIMNLIDAKVIKVLDKFTRDINGKTFYFYIVEYEDIKGRGISRIAFEEENNLVKEGFIFSK